MTYRKSMLRDIAEGPLSSHYANTDEERRKAARKVRKDLKGGAQEVLAALGLETNMSKVVISETPDGIELECPHCGGIDTIVERDVTYRWNEIVYDSLTQDGDTLRASAAVGEEKEFERDELICRDCTQQVEVDIQLDYL